MKKSLKTEEIHSNFDIEYLSRKDHSFKLKSEIEKQLLRRNSYQSHKNLS